MRYQVERLATFFPHLLLLSGAYQRALLDLAHLSNLRVVPDPCAHAGKGPMAGLLAGLRCCSTEWLAVLPIDSPYFPPQAFDDALALVGQHRVLGWIDAEGKQQWLPGLYHRGLMSSLERSLEREALSLGRWVADQNPAYLPWTRSEMPAPRAFININTPAQAAASGFAMPAEGMKLEGT